LPFQPSWCALFPHAQQVVIAGGHHFPVNDDPHGAAAAIRSWWQDSSCGQVRGGCRSWRSVFVS
jgi:hypothetical protein